MGAKGSVGGTRSGSVARDRRKIPTFAETSVPPTVSIEPSGDRGGRSEARAGRGRWMFGIPGTSTHLWECREVRSRVSRGLCRAVLLSASKSDRTSSAGRREAFFGAFSRRFLRRDFGLGRKVSPKIIQGAQTHRPCAGPADSGTRGACASAGGSLGAVSVGPPTNAGWKASLDTPPRCVSASSWSESCPRRTMIW